MKVPQKTTKSVTKATDEPFTAENYKAAFIAHGSLIALQRPIAPAAWHAWTIWYEMHGIPGRWREKHGVDTVPTLWPEAFDPDWSESDRAWTPPVPAPVDPAARERIRAGLARLAETLSMKQPRDVDRRYGEAPTPTESPLERVNRLTAEYAKTPAAIGPHLQRQFAEKRAEERSDAYSS